MSRIIITVICSCIILAEAAFGGTKALRCVGVLGNSGEQGSSLVRYSEQRSRDLRDGLGVTCDRFGTLWDRAGAGCLNRYAMDGRLLQSVKLPATRVTHLDAACLVDDSLVLLLAGELFLLDVAASTPELQKSSVKIRSMAKSAADGRVLVLVQGESQQLALYRPAEDSLYELPWPPLSADSPLLGVDIQGAPMVIDRSDKNVYKWVDGTWQKIANFREGQPQTLDGYYWTGQWHGTVKRFNADFAPDPGVVLGGASGSFIGHLEGNYELDSPTAIASAGPSVYALGGLGGVAHLASWDGASRKLELVRRIGALHDIRGHLAIDATGKVRTPAGFWEWGDGPTSPVKLSTGLAGNGQVAVFENGSFFASAFVYSTLPAAMWGTFDSEPKTTNARYMPEVTFPDNARGCAPIFGEKNIRSLRLTADSRLIETRHDGVGRPVEEIAVGTLNAAEPVSNPTSLASLPDGRMLAGADGFVLEIARHENPGDWKENRRIKSISGESFGDEIFITASGNNVWISDADNHRVLCVDESLSTILAAFGGVQGDDMEHCDRPGAIAASGSRAVVYDSGNQRLLKLMLE
ncbi:MAG: hypothetical protein GX804_00135 [Lentisphaerae bacterium]|nr:hypothetical protein [Lentisphaerota bacterium]